MLRLPPAPLRLTDRRRLAAGIAAFAAAMLVALFGLYATAETPTAAPSPQGVVKLRLLGVNDLHGHLEPPRSGLGGAAWLKAHLDRAALPGRTLRVHAGDMVGASPLISSHFHDEPAIEVANRIGFDVGTVGNHEFDEGDGELLRLLHGGRRSDSSPHFAGARFPYVAANSLDRDGRLLLPPFRVVERAGVRVGFIGVTTPSTPKFLLARHSERLRFTDISDAVNRWAPELRRRGVEAIVVLAHAGAPEQDEADVAQLRGEIVDEAREMSDAVDVVIAGHSHTALDLRVPNASGSGDKLVVEALSYGVAYDRVDIAVDRASGQVVAKSAEVAPTPHADVAPDRAVAALVQRYAQRVAPLADRVVGDLPSALTRAGGELGRLVADAQRAFASADVAVVHPGSLRADIDAGPVSYAEVAGALAYDHPLVRMELAGADLRPLLGRAGLFVSGPAEGHAVDPDRTYTVVASELIATGDTLHVLSERGRVRRRVGSEAGALAWYLERAAAR